MRYSYELVYEKPFIRNLHHHIYIREIQENGNGDDFWHKEIIGSISMDWIFGDNSRLDSCLIEIAQTKDTIRIGAYKNNGRPYVCEEI